MTSLLFAPLTGTGVWADSKYVQVTVDNLNVRTGPALTYPVASTVDLSTKLPVVKEENNWTQVKLPNGQTGWLASWLLKPVATASTATYIHSKVTNLNVRKGPSQTFQVIAQINPNETYQLMQKNGEWAQIKLANGQTGWVASWHVEETKAAATGQGSTTSGTASSTTGSTAAKPSTPTSTATPAAPNTGTNNGTATSGTLTATESVTVYGGPDTGFPTIGKLSKGDKVPHEMKSGTWYLITYNGQKAWVNGAKGVTVQASGQSGSGQTTPSTPAGQSGTVTPAATATVKVVSTSLNLRSQPTTTSSSITLLSSGASLTLLAQSGDWYQVKTSDGKTGWVANWLVSKPDNPNWNQSPSTGTPSGNTGGSSGANAGTGSGSGSGTGASTGQGSVTILEPDTNIRKSPSTSAEIISRVRAGETFPIVRTEGDWFLIQLADGTTGYVAGWIVSATGVSNVVRSTTVAGKVIVLDAGHGGDDAGAIGTSFSTQEKVINLQVTQYLKNKLEAAGARVIMTRNDDRKLTLQGRVDVAVTNKADLFVSVHHNTHPNAMTNGTIIFYYREGESKRLASLVQSEVVKSTGYKDMNARFGDYFVLRENPVTSILCEVGFMTNYQEEAAIRSSQKQDQAAEGIYKGIVRYFQGK
ncbi:SH3 domain-containing protein [Brevibacillus dissolubilis]|uniref:SH3 domain-containing protein n=1 Tax=Brevibacillus dissolubilis TaxID=1844116 RepID=UPI002100042D|nr:SH3 domain-containing protein [Brevibacillus dissolubilis]